MVLYYTVQCKPIIGALQIFELKFQLALRQLYASMLQMSTNESSLSLQKETDNWILQLYSPRKVVLITTLYTPLLILCFRIPYNKLCLPPKFCRNWLFSNAPGNTTFSQEHLKTQKDCIMENSKIVNTWKFLTKEISLSFRGEYYNTIVLFP